MHQSIQIDSKLLDKNSKIGLVELGGYIDQANTYLLQREIDNHIQNQVFKLIFNMQNLAYMSSAGWGVLIGEIKRFRENGGDIKITNMKPEVYEIFQMLEFYHILNDYSSIDKAIESFGVSTSTDKTQIEAEPMDKQDTSEKYDSEISEDYGTSDNGREEVVFDGSFDIDVDDVFRGSDTETQKYSSDVEHIDFVPSSRKPRINKKMLPIQEKIKSIVAEQPYLTPRKIRKKLKSEEFGFVKVGYFKLRSLLKQLELDTREKRFRYYRSC